MLKRAEEFIYENKLIEKGDKVLAALSGGADSVAMLMILLALKDKIGFSVAACHVNHNLRGEDSNRDEEFCRVLCERHGVKLFVKNADVKSVMKNRGESLETAARNVRYEYFDSLIKGEGFDKAATAHNADDNAETVLMHIIRGCGIDALCGIKAKNEHIIRPILFAKRQEIEIYLKDISECYVTDKTNFEPDCTRNKIRLELLKYIKDNLNPSVSDSINRLACFAKTDSEYILKNAREAYNLCKKAEKLDINEYNKLDEAVALRVMKEFLSDMLGRKHDISSDTVFRLHELAKEGKTGKRIPVSHKIFVQKSYGFLVRAADEAPKEICLPLAVGKSVCAHGYKVECSLVRSMEKSDTNTAYFDMDGIENLTVRTRRSGDVFYPFGSGKKKLKDYFIDKKIPREMRDKTLLIESGGNILWVCGVKRSKFLKVNNETKNILKITISEGVQDVLR